MTVDPRTLGALRLVLGFLLIADGLRHWEVARLYYSNAGILTNHFHLFRPDGAYNFSIFHAFSTPAEVHVLFAIGIAIYFCFFIGYQTRLFSILSFLFVVSMDNRLVMVENGGYVVVNLIVGYAMFMPMGRRFSVDAWLESFRRRHERSTRDLNAPRQLPNEPFVSTAVLLATLNFATIYFFNVVNKSGGIWRAGETVHYVLHLDRMVTLPAVWLRELLPLWSMRPMAWVVLSVEALLVALILAPSGRRITRPLAMFLIAGLHTSFGVLMRLGPFSWFMIGWSVLLLTPVQWEGLGAWHRRRARAVVAVYDRRSPLAFALARVLVRLDPHRLIRFRRSPSKVEMPPLFEVRWEGEDAGVSGPGGLARALSAVPFGRALWLTLWTVTLGTLPHWLGVLSRRREGVARFFGLSLDAADAAAADLDLPPSPLCLRGRRTLAVARESFLVYFGLCAVSQVLNENKAVPDLLKHEQPEVVRMTIGYPRLYQGWGMFSPNPIQEDGIVVVEAWTIDGRRIDPFTGRLPDLDLTDARGLGMGQIQQDYFNRIRLDRNRGYREGLRQYLVRWHEETGRPEDELVAFDVYWVRDLCPPPGELGATDNEIVPLLTHRRPGYRQPPGKPPIPPSPKVASAERHSKLPEPKKKGEEEPKESGEAGE